MNNLLLLSVIVFLIILILSTFWIIDYFKSKKFKHIKLKVVLMLGLLFIEYLTLPWWFLALAYNTNNINNMESYHKLSVKTAIIPYTKSIMYENLGSHYYNIKKDGPNAIKYLEISQSMHSLPKLCALYTIKGDFEKGIDVCNTSGFQQLVAVNYILKNDYSKALKIMNEKINDDSKVSCWDYATRAYTYRKLGKNNLFKKDYLLAEQLCPDVKEMKKLYENENYFVDKYSKLKKQYKL